jgi:hypothetical protein
VFSRGSGRPIGRAFASSWPPGVSTAATIESFERRAKQGGRDHALNHVTVAAVHETSTSHSRILGGRRPAPEAVIAA